ncbi:hypothetical protein Hanom_Chr03g00277661 [Helianthus anomalus]
MGRSWSKLGCDGSLVLKSERRTKATRSKIEARSAKRKSGGLFVPEAQDVYIIFFIYPIHIP